MKRHQHILPNGLTILGETRPFAKDVAVGFFVRTGSRDEIGEFENYSGLSHFAEHMAFRNSETLTAEEIAEGIARIGGKANAGTGFDTTSYYTLCLPRFASKAVALLSKMLRPALDPEQFAKEQGVILEEIAKSEDEPYRWLIREAMATYFASHTAGNYILGRKESVSRITPEVMASYFKARYGAGNIAVSVAGNFDWEQIVSDVETHCGDWETGTATRSYQSFTPPPPAKLELKKAGLNMAYSVSFGPGPSAQDPLLEPAELLIAILGSPKGSKAYWKLLSTGIAEAAMISPFDADRVGCIIAGLQCAPERLASARSLLNCILATPREFDAGDLQRVKNKVSSSLAIQSESAMSCMRQMGSDWIYSKPSLSIKQILEKVEVITRDDIEQAIENTSNGDLTPVLEVTLLPE